MAADPARSSRSTRPMRGPTDRVYSLIRNCTSRWTDLSPGLLNTAGSIERARRRSLDIARQPFTMNNHLVEILLHSWRGNVCLKPPGSRRCCAIVRVGCSSDDQQSKISSKWPAFISTSPCIRVTEVQGRGQSVRSHRCPERQHQDHSRRPAFIEIAACLSSPRRQVASICDRM
jgi:hypothetical protein